MIDMDLQVVREAIDLEQSRLRAASIQGRRWRSKLMKLADKLRSIRGDRPQKLIAKLAGVPQGYVSQVESGSVRFDTQSLLRVLDAYAQLEREAHGPVDGDEGASYRVPRTGSSPQGSA